MALVLVSSPEVWGGLRNASQAVLRSCSSARVADQHIHRQVRESSRQAYFL